MRQRLALATALLGEPRVLVLDEPANGLDPEGVAWIRELLRDFAARGGTVLVSSHVLSEVELLADRVVIVARGRLVAEGATADLAGQDHVVSVVTDDPGRLLTWLAEAGASAVRTGPDRLRVTGLPPVEIGRIARRHDVDLHELASRRASLEDVFLELTSNAAPNSRGAPAETAEPW